MPNIIEGKSKANPNDKLAIIVSKFNEFITEKLLEGCLQTLIQNGANEKNIDAVKVPGAFGIPTAAKNLIESKKYSAIICLGCVIRGETPHFDYICTTVSNEISHMGATFNIPIIFGVLTCENVDQAIERSSGKIGNRGTEAALAAMEMSSLLKQLNNIPIKT